MHESIQPQDGNGFGKGPVCIQGGLWPMSYSVEDYGYEKAIKQIEGLEKNAKRRYQTYIEKLADAIISEAKSNLQNHQNISTGELLGSIGILEKNGGMDILIGSRLKYANHIEYGRGPVDAKDTRHPLHWKDKQTGEDVFSMHSGPTQPSPFMEPAVIHQTKKFPQVFLQNEGEYAKEVLG